MKVGENEFDGIPFCNDNGENKLGVIPSTLEYSNCYHPRSVHYYPPCLALLFGVKNPM
jgi:hypothetical protein